MRRLATLALALCLYAPAHAAARRATPARGPLVDGVPARQRAKGPRSRGALRKRGRKKGAAARAAAADDTPRQAAPAPAVTEIDTEGLKKLLARGDDPSRARPLLVNFWATWCDPCREEFPDLVKIDADYKGRGLDIALISGDDISEIKTGVPKFLREMKAGMPAYLLNVPDMALAINTVDATWYGDLPATFVYDREGKMVFKHFGRIAPKEVRAALDRALGGK
ncbi:MAG TPA: redoxin domain-containing protein [Pyrinomonadaceae bacterium]|jgi:thiol-disulfide isomerase/thioredoxin